MNCISLLNECIFIPDKYSDHKCASWLEVWIVIMIHKSLCISRGVQIVLTSSPSTSSWFGKNRWQILRGSGLIRLFGKCLVSLIFNEIVFLPFIFRIHECCWSKSSSLHMVEAYWSRAPVSQDLDMVEILIHEIFLTVWKLNNKWFDL